MNDIKIKKRVLIVGAGNAGSIIANEINANQYKNWKIVGFVDDDVNKQGTLISGIKVIGKCENISDIVREENIQELLIAMPSAPTEKIRKIVENCSHLSCKMNILPSFCKLIDDDVLVPKIRDIAVEDLLVRDTINLDSSEIATYIKNKTILVTGAGGSIGSEICRQLIIYKPRKIILLGHGENSIYLIHRELICEYPNGKFIPVIADVRDKQTLRSVFKKYKPDVVFHAAAHKHVPMMEIQPKAAILNNVIGTKVMTEVACETNVERFVMVSTDKAVNPTSVMGATKRIAEMIVQSFGKNNKTKFTAVRFGNVLGSRGSVVPLFKRQIASGGPVTVTDPNITRYFMTIPEASQLVLEAGALGEGGEVFLLDMGEPVRILDLAIKMIKLSGLRVGKDIDIVYTGLRPGEKLYEELLTAEEGTRRTKHDKIFISKLEEIDKSMLDNKIIELQNADSDMEIIETMKEMIPTYHPNHDM